MSTTNEILLEVKRLKTSAKANRDFEDYNEAITDLQRAISLLLPLYEEMNRSQSGVSEYRVVFQRELADCYGMIGGIYRRLEELEKSAQNYNKGLEFEIDDSYNRSNAIVVSILKDASQLAQMQKEIKAGIDIIQDQVRGKRKDQWWAWADLGLLNLLYGDLDAALNAYGQFKRMGARNEDYESTMSVLTKLGQALTKVKSPAAKDIDKAVHFLKDSQTS